MPVQPKLTRAEKKAALMQHAEALVEQLLDWEEATPQPTLTQLEDQALRLRQQFGQVLTESVLADQDNREPVQLPPCPQCHKHMRPKGLKRKTVLSRVGELELERSYFYCPGCARGFFPPG